MSIKLATADFVIITFFVDFHDFVAFLPIDSLNERKPTSGFWNFLLLVSVEFLIIQ